MSSISLFLETDICVDNIINALSSLLSILIVNCDISFLLAVACFFITFFITALEFLCFAVNLRQNLISS